LGGEELFVGWLGGLGAEREKQWQNNTRTIEKQRKTTPNNGKQ